MPSLTRTEAAERGALLTVRSTAVQLDLTTGPAEFGSTTTLVFDCARPGAATFLDVKPARLRSATLNGVALDLGTFADERLPLPDLAATNELTVVADMKYSHEGEGLHRYVDPADQRVYLYAQLFLDAAPRMFACFDQPDLKSRYTFAVTAPESWKVLGNGASELVDGTWRLVETQPLSTYFVTLVAGPYHSVYAEHDGIPLGLHCRASIAEFLDVDTEELFTVTGQCFDEYHRLFGVRYPFGKYDQVFVPEFNAGAMENPGCVTFRDQFIYRSAVTEGERERRAMVVAHEMAHMWFGDLVTMRWWDDLWLNESFADYLGHRVTADATRFTEAWTAFSAGHKGGGYGADQRPSTHPVSGEVPDALAGLVNFDQISYAKGASVLRQLAAVIGDEALLDGLKAYFAAHAFGNASLSDFLSALSTSSGRDLSGWATKWLRSANVNTLYPEFEYADGVISAAAIRQTAPDTHPVLRPHTLDVGLYGPGAEVVRVAIDGARTDLPALIGRPAPDLVLLNDGDFAYAKIRFDERSLAALPRLLPGLSTGNRALVWTALAQSVRDGDLPARTYLDLATLTLAAEAEITILEEVLKQSRTAMLDAYLDPADRPAALASTVAGYRRALAEIPASDSRRLAFYRALINSGDDAAELRAALAGDGVPAGLTVDVELGWMIRSRLAVLGELTAAEIDAAYAADHSAQGEEHAAFCRAARPDPAAKRAIWDAIMTDGELSNYTVWAYAEGFWHPEQAELTAPYVERYFTELPAAAALRSAQVLQSLAQLLYPRYAIDPATEACAEALLTRADLPAALRRPLMDRTDDLCRALAARGTA